MEEKSSSIFSVPTEVDLCRPLLDMESNCMWAAFLLILCWFVDWELTCQKITILCPGVCLCVCVCVCVLSRFFSVLVHILLKLIAYIFQSLKVSNGQICHLHYLPFCFL